MPVRTARHLSESTATPQPHLGWQQLLHGWTLAVVMVMIALLGSLLGTGWWLNQHLAAFTTATGTPWRQVAAELTSAWRQTPAQQQPLTVLLLGLDSLAQRGNSPPLTDTMMLISFNPDQQRVSLLPLPRDLWSDAYQTKINALYTYGLEQDPSQPAKLSTQGIAQLTGLTPDLTVTVSLDQVATLIDALGGIEIDVPTGFVDDQFPRTDVDVTIERDPAKLYERIEFSPGVQRMSGERALKYIRSRHSVGDEGDDVARGRRQQLVIRSLIATLAAPETLTNTTTLGTLYRFYDQHYRQQVPLGVLVAAAKNVAQQRAIPEFIPLQLTIFPEDPQGMITHPPLSPQHQHQWVYVVRQPAQFPNQVRSLLRLPPR